MAKRVYLYDIPSGVVEKTSVRVLLDMMRYDASHPVSNPTPGHYTFQSEFPPTEARWLSFGIRILNVRKQLY